LRRRVKGEEHPEVASLKREILSELENLSEQQQIDLYYGDEAAVALEPCIPYAWQFADEQAGMPSLPGKGINCFALLARDNRAVVETTRANITARFIFEQFEQLSLKLKRLTVVVLDNARMHRARIIKERIEVWQQRGLYLFYLPRYSPHLNIVETLWRKLKYEWLRPSDYETRETLSYAVRQALKAVGESLFIQFSGFSHSSLLICRST
jgi:transposase